MFTQLSSGKSTDHQRRYKHMFKKIHDLKHQYVYKAKLRRFVQCLCAIFIIILIFLLYQHIISIQYLSSIFDTNKHVNKTTNYNVSSNHNNANHPSLQNELGMNLSKLLEQNGINIVQFIKHYGENNLSHPIENKKSNKSSSGLINIWNKNISDTPPIKISKSVLNDIEISNVVWDFGACGCTGWGVETVNIIKPLYDRVCSNIKLITDYDCWCPGFLDSTVDLMNSLQSTSDYLDWDGNENGIEIFISHKPASRYPTFPYYGLINIAKRPQIVIGRSMIEVDYIPKDDLDRMKSSQWIDELWVPSRFVKIIYVQNGIHPNKIRVIPPAINIDIYPPKQKIKAYKHLPSLNRKKKLIKITKKTFRFLSVFKWEPRKGYDVLLTAFLREFQRKDDVQLYLQTYAYAENSGRSREVSYLQAKLNETILQIIEVNDDIEYEYVMKYMYPKIEIMSKRRSMKQLASLYATVNCVVLASHGEGFGLPILEAMAVATPVMVTKWSGLRDLVINETYGYLIDIDGREMARNTPGRYDFIEDKQKWAKINVTSLMGNMRNVYKYRKKAKRIGRNGQKFVYKHFHPNIIADKIKTRMKELVYLKKNNQSFLSV